MKRLRLLCLLILLMAVGSVAYLKVKHGQSSDSIAPKITMDKESITVNVKDGEDVLLSGITAQDNKDGDVTDSLAIDTISSFSADGKRYVEIAAFDSSNNVGKATRVITYKDYRSPHFDITEPLIFAKGSRNFLDNITANDLLDGDLTGSIHFEDNTMIYTDEAGDNDAKITVTNSAGDTAVLPVTIKILESGYDDKPRVHLKHYVRYIKKGGKIDYTKLMDGVVVNGQQKEIVNGDDETNKTVNRNNITINDDKVKYKKPGVYKVTYKVSIEQGTETITGTTTLYVVVEE